MKILTTEKKVIDKIEFNEPVGISSGLFVILNMIYVAEYYFGDPFYKTWWAGFLAGIIEIFTLALVYFTLKAYHYKQVIEVVKDDSAKKV